MPALVTGGTGFVGSNLVAALIDRGIRVRVLQRATSSTAALDGLDYEMCVGDVLDDADTLAAMMADCAWVFHTAAISDYWRHRGRKRLYRTNVEGTRNMSAAAVGAARAVVGRRLPIDGRQMRLSSAAIYADGSKARDELGVPATPFRTAAKSAYEWYLENDYLRG
jgi:nucleoside-diphosphate-sugar epimerase